MFGVNVPVPLVDQLPVLDAPDTLPFKGTFKLLTQTVVSLPAFTTGAGVMVIIISSVALLQLFAVSVMVTEPLAISAALGR